MTLALAAIALATAINPLRAWSVLPPGPSRRSAAGLGAVLALALVVLGAALGTPVLGWVDISAPMARLAAGIVLLLAGAWGLIGPPLPPEPALPGWRAGLVPVAVPALVRPEVFLVAVVVGADHGVLPTIALAVPVLVVVVLLSLVPTPDPAASSGRALGAGTRFVAGLATASGLALLMDGLYAL
jgi:small neutral amino acid transporter SnatA (MarC family)